VKELTGAFGPINAQSTLARHADVAKVAVDDQRNHKGDQQLVAFVVPAEHVPLQTRKSLQKRRLAEWKTIYGFAYSRQRDSSDFGENFAEYTSIYDGRSFASTEIEEWRDCTVDAILALRPRRILEIGSGSGLILSKVAPRCEKYWATDLSSGAVDIASQAVAGSGELAGVVEVRHQPAHDFDQLPAGYFDTVVLNSVVQYFPHVDYLIEVLRKALELVIPGGAIFLGDIRNRRLQRSLRAGVELHNADGDTTAATLRRAIDQQVLGEQELLLDPEFFSVLPSYFEDIAAVDVRLKRGVYHNEFTRYRYDVVLHRSPARIQSIEDSGHLCWETDIRDIDMLDKYLEVQCPVVMRLNGVPNARLTGETAALRSLERDEPMSSIVETLRAAERATGVDPEVCHHVGRRRGYDVRATWSTETHDGHFDVAFVKRSGMGAETNVTLRPPAVRSAGPTAHANDPLDGGSSESFTKSLQAHLARRFGNIQLPETKFVIVDELPTRTDATRTHKRRKENHMSSSSDQSYDFTTADFNSVYQGGELMAGAEIKSVPWDIGEEQPAVVELERLGRIRGEVLDAGCGLGDNAIFLARSGYRVTAIDYASGAIDQAKQRARGLDIEFAVADATVLAGYEGRFDTVLDSALYHTMDESGRQRLLEALHRSTTPGARLNMLCFANATGGMPAPLSVSETSVRTALDAAGWSVTDLHQTAFVGVASAVREFANKAGLNPDVDEKGRFLWPTWMVQADRR
jgi:2-polyprenyl-3-methyl-5-hydroxy-6-metoxy-1,4-benzoquinol methylase